MEENYNQPQQPQVVPPTPPMYQTPDMDDIPPMKPTNWLWQSIVATLLCCLPFGIVGIIYATRVDSLYHQGRYAESEKASKNAKTWTLISVGAAIIYYIVLALMFVTGNLPDSLENIIESSSGYNY